MSNYAPAIALLLFSLCLSVYASARVSDDATQVAVFFPLQNSLQDNIDLASKADMTVVRAGSFDQILIVEKKSKDSMMTLYKLGAIAAFNPLFLGGCMIQSPPSASQNKSL